MSKVNRRNEIKQKEELQARFQLSLAQNNAKALSWLKPMTVGDGHQMASKTPAASGNEPVANESFFNLPIIPNGASLSSLNDTSSKDISRIGDFIANDGKMNGIKQESTSRGRKELSSSKPMLALMNKMRDTNREKIRHKQGGGGNTGNTTIINTTNNGRSHGGVGKESNNHHHQHHPRRTQQQASSRDEEDSDDESSILKSRTVKKGSGMLLESKLGKKKGRPF
ncbi:uncharacterized protein RJT20DRAFT_36002 [Scheffersomyces xylosifermentans]|uniref:uncharacterized protein n=1 Tax=Scheffersomyces xylosifermentans TaxID=1304137 RepID=UPI00315C5EB6